MGDKNEEDLSGDDESEEDQSLDDEEVGEEEEKNEVEEEEVEDEKSDDKEEIDDDMDKEEEDDVNDENKDDQPSGDDDKNVEVDDDGTCKDDPSFAFKKKPGMTCNKMNKKKCNMKSGGKRVFKSCPKTCGKCSRPDDNNIISNNIEDDGTGGDGDEECKDDASFRFKGKTCKFVKKKAKKNRSICNKKKRGTKIKVSCPAACGKC